MKRFFLMMALTAIGLFSMAQAKTSVSILGDSYSTYEGYLTPDTMEIWYFANNQDLKRTDVTRVSQTWWMQLIKKMGWKLERNNSWSGSTICNSGYRDEDYSCRAFITRLDNLGSPDVILIFGGTNDAWANAPIGDYKYKDWKRADLYCFRPAMAYLLDHLLERYPTAEIDVISNCDIKPEITHSMAEIAHHYGVKLIQLENIDKQNGHPTIKGMTAIADQIAKSIQR